MRISLRRLALYVVGSAFLLLLVLNWTWGRLPGEPKPPPGSKHVLVDGVDMHYVERPGKGPGVVMIHGQPGTYLDWSLVQDELDGMHTIAIDRPGYGYSSGGYLPFTEQVDLIHEMIGKLGMRDAVIAGHSYGGAIAFAHAERYADDTPAIVPVSPMINSDDNTEQVRSQANAIKVLYQPGVRQLTNFTFNQLFSKLTVDNELRKVFSPSPIPDAYRQQMLGLTMKAQNMRTFAEETLQVRPHFDPYSDRFKRVRVPTWVVMGRDDGLVSPRKVTALTKKLKDGHLTMVDGGHMQTWSHPKAVAAAIRRASR